MVTQPVILALAESSIVSLTTTVAGVVGGALLGLLVYIWRTNISELRRTIDRTESGLAGVVESVVEADKTKADRSELTRIMEEMRSESRENQARYVFLNETLTGALGSIRQEFARASECGVKHATLQDGLHTVNAQLRENKQVLQDMARKLDQILEWKAFKSGEEQGRKDR